MKLFVTFLILLTSAIPGALGCNLRALAEDEPVPEAIPCTPESFRSNCGDTVLTSGIQTYSVLKILELGNCNCYPNFREFSCCFAAKAAEIGIAIVDWSGLTCLMAYTHCLDTCPPVLAACTFPPATPPPTTVILPPPVTPAPTTKEGSCFSGLNTLDVLNQGVTPIGDVQVGDQVLTAGGDYEPVYALAHFNPKEENDYVQIHVKAQNTPLEVVPNHLVFKADASNPVRADSIKVGDVLKEENGGGAVTKIRNVQREGTYNPLTPSGTLVVNGGVVASTYIPITEHEGIMSHHDYTHLMLSPFRLMCMGISSRMCEIYNEQGIPHYIAWGMKLHEWADKQNVLVKFAFFLLATAFTGVCMIGEKVLGASTVPLALFLFSMSFLAMRKRSAGKVKTV
jgi:hypothetical protein